MAVGHTVVLCQTEEIHQSFYDLFNQQFLLINDPTKGQCYYANIAIGAHTKLCRVDPRFQCVVVLRKSNLQFTPPPFLNRFEKYSLSYQSIFEASLKKTPCLKIVVDVAYKKVCMLEVVSSMHSHTCFVALGQGLCRLYQRVFVWVYRRNCVLTSSCYAAPTKLDLQTKRSFWYLGRRR